jgi:magnesium transporter
MISIDVSHDEKVACDVAPRDLKAHLNDGTEPRKVAWVDVMEPTGEDWRWLIETFGFHPLAIEDAQQQNQRAKADDYEGYFYLSVRHWISFKKDANSIPEITDEIDVFLGDNYLVTIHKRECPPIAEMRRRWERHPQRMPKEPSFLLYVLLDTVVDGYFPAVDALTDAIEELEDKVYEDSAPLDVKPALALKKHALLLRQTLSPIRDLLNHFLRTDHPLVAPATRVYYLDVYDHALRLVEQVDLQRDILSGTLDAVMAQTSNRLNKVMKTMTGISTILMSAALIAGIYGMNFENMPELRTRYGYFLTLGGMAAVSLGLAMFFRRIKWF